MPGQPRKEVSMNLPAMLEAAEALGPNHEFLLPVAPTLNQSFLQTLIGNAVVDMCRSFACTGPFRGPELLPVGLQR